MRHDETPLGGYVQTRIKISSFSLFKNLLCISIHFHRLFRRDIKNHNVDPNSIPFCTHYVLWQRWSTKNMAKEIWTLLIMLRCPIFWIPIHVLCLRGVGIKTKIKNIKLNTSPKLASKPHYQNKRKYLSSPMFS